MNKNVVPTVLKRSKQHSREGEAFGCNSIVSLFKLFYLSINIRLLRLLFSLLTLVCCCICLWQLDDFNRRGLL